MIEDPTINVFLGDLGFGLFDKIRARFPDRCINVGASEQLMIGAATGMTLQGKKVVCYSITPFLIYRPFEQIRNFLHIEQIPVKLVGSGRNDDYKKAGFTHFSFEAEPILKILENIDSYFPNTTDDLQKIYKEFIFSTKPAFLSLKK